MAVLLSRSVHEEHAYLEMHPCECGDQTVTAWSGEGVYGVTGARRTYSWACPRCRTPRRFEFFAPKERRAPATQPFGDGRSDILDPGQWLVLGDRYAGLAADRSRPHEDRRLGRWLAPAAIQEVLKFIPPEAEEVPASAFTSETGRAVQRAQRDAFRRDSLVQRAARYAKGRLMPASSPPAVAGSGRRGLADRNWYADMFRLVSLATVPLVIGGVIITWAGGGDISATYFASMTAAVASARFGQFAGTEAGFTLAGALLARQYGVSPSVFVVPWQGAWRLHRIWRSLLWLAGVAAAEGYFTGWLPRSWWITTDLAVLGALVAGRIAYGADFRAEARAGLRGYAHEHDEITGPPSYAQPPVLRPSRAALYGSAVLAACVTVLAETIGDRAASGSPVFWVVVAAVLLAVLEPVTGHRAESISERRLETELRRRHRSDHGY